MLRISGLDVYIGAVQVLNGVSLEVPAGAMCGLIGRNGAGKTTLMRSIMGLLPARNGSIEYEHYDLLKTHPHRRAPMGIGYMPEDRKLVPEFTAEDNVLLPAWATQMEDAADRLAWVYDLMPEVKDFRDRRANQLSGGQQKMVALARALLCGTRLLLLDEPFEGVAPALASRLAQVIAALKGEGLSVLVADSNERHLIDMVDLGYAIERGAIERRISGAEA